MLIGTHYFKSQNHANCYYADYGDTPADVQRKIDADEIRIHSTPLEMWNGKAVKACRLIDNGCRWQVEV